LLGSAEVHTRPTGEKIVHVRLDSARHLYLQEHVFDGKMVLPAAAALELMAEGARAFWPRWCVAAVQEMRVLKNIELERGTADVQLHLSPPPYGSSEGFEVSASIKTDAGGGKLQVHFQCVVRMEQSLPTADPAARVIHKDKSLSVAKAYGEWLAHGPRLQTIENIDGLSGVGAAAQVRTTLPHEWLALAQSSAGVWVFDPALLNAATQMVSLWARTYREENAQPARFGRVVRYREATPARLQMEFQRIESADPAMIRGNVVFFDDKNEVVLAIEDLDCTASAILNRVGGKARAAQRAVA
jgi:hypothetical protein